MATPLTLMLPLRQDAEPERLLQTIQASQATLNRALDLMGVMHFARLLLLDRASPNLQPEPDSRGSHVLAMLAEYDGELADCVQQLASEWGPQLDAMLDFVEGGAGLIPCVHHAAALADFISRHDASRAQADLTHFQAYYATAREIAAALP